MNTLYKYILRIADDSLILGQRQSEMCGHGPILEEDIAQTNIALDLIGQATALYEYAATFTNGEKSSDDIAFLRFDREYSNLLLVEQPNGDFGQTIVRNWIFDTFRVLFFEELTKSKDTQLAAIAEKSLKETRYHWKHSSEWLIRLGDGTEESHNRTQDALNRLWKYSDEVFYMDEIEKELIEQGIAVDLNTIRQKFIDKINYVLSESTLTLPTNEWRQSGGRIGKHTEHLGFILAEMQYMQRAYPGMEW
ncbi:MAG: 1,2-phenylacetyl-CoA epoxidase subunit PaaC [Fluviicola sp.]|jgi:ring-1,2-phenylacetyl-CoA epoxidase subunit PaaC